jgi:hypothetical protein
MHRVKAKVEAEKDRRQLQQGQKRSASDDKLSRPQQRRRSSQQRGGSGSAALPTSPTPISPRTTSSSTLPMLASGAPTGSPTNSFNVGVNGTRSFTPQSQTGSSPAGSELVFPFAMGTQQGIYTPFGNSPPLFPVLSGAQSHVQLPAEMMDMTRGGDDDGSGQFWQSLFGPPGSSLPPPQYTHGFAHPGMTSANQGSTSPHQRTSGEFRDPNDVNIEMGGDSSVVNLDEIDSGLVDWGEFIAQCSQVWVTE